MWGGQTPGRRPRQAAGKCSGSGCEAGERERPCAAAGGGRGDGRAAIAGDPGVSGGGEGGRRPCGRVVDENPRLCSIAGPVESAGCVYLIYRTGGCQCPPSLPFPGVSSRGPQRPGPAADPCKDVVIRSAQSQLPTSSLWPRHDLARPCLCLIGTPTRPRLVELVHARPRGRPSRALLYSCSTGQLESRLKL